MSSPGGLGQREPFSKGEASITAIKTILSLAKDIGEIFSNVPYVKSLAGLLVQILSIREEIEHLKDVGHELIELIALRSLPIMKALVDLRDHPAEELPDALQQMKSDLEAYDVLLNNILASLSKLAKRHLAFRIVHRSAMKSELERYMRSIENFQGTFIVSRLIELCNANASTTSDDHTGSSMFRPPLPALREPLVGRDTEVAQLTGLLLSCANPRIAIIGTGGIGKTSLATALLHDPAISALYKEYRYFASCEKIKTTIELLNGIANVLHIPHAARGQKLLSNVIKYLCRGPTLLCLDNLEDPWDVPDERRHIEDILSLFDAIPELGIIITTRVSERPSGLSWTNPIPQQLQPLHEDHAVALFEKTASSSDSRIPSIVNAVDRVPLAIELLARHVKQHSFDVFMEIWESEGLGVLDSGSALDHRLSSVYASIRLSLASLRIADHQSAATVLRVLAALPDGLAASTVTQVQSFFPRATRLSQCLRVLCSASLMHKDTRGRYRILAPIRQYVEEFLQLNAEHMCGMTLAFASLISDDKEPSKSPHFHVTAAELPNVEAMVLTGLELFEPGAQLEQVVHAASDLTYWQHYVALPNLDVLHAALLHASTAQLKGRCQHTLGVMYWHLDYFREAETSLLLAIPLFHDCGDALMEARSWRMLGDVHRLLGHSADAEVDLQRAFPLFVQTGDLLRQGEVLSVLGCLLFENKDTSGRRYGDAEACLLHALSIHRRLEHIPAQVNSHTFLGRLYFGCARLDDAEPHFVEALELAKQIKHTDTEAWSHRYLGEVHLFRHGHANAETSFFQAVALFSQMNNRASEAGVHLLLGQLYAQMYDLSAPQDSTIKTFPLDDAARELALAISLYQQPHIRYLEEDQTQQCLYFLELPRFDLFFDPPEPKIWERATDTYEQLISRILPVEETSHE